MRSEYDGAELGGWSIPGNGAYSITVTVETEPSGNYKRSFRAGPQLFFKDGEPVSHAEFNDALAGEQAKRGEMTEAEIRAQLIP